MIRDNPKSQHILFDYIQRFEDKIKAVYGDKEFNIAAGIVPRQFSLNRISIQKDNATVRLRNPVSG